MDNLMGAGQDHTEVVGLVMIELWAVKAGNEIHISRDSCLCWE